MRKFFKTLTIGLFVIVMICACGTDPDEINEKEMTESKNFADNIGGSGIGMDSIPPLENPTYVSIDKMEGNDLYNMEDRDYVFLLQINSQVLVYPRKIMVYHEIVNDEVDGYKFTMTY